MIRFFAGHPTAANLLMLVFIILGLKFAPGIRKETMPEIKHYEVQVQVVYPGANPLEVEDSICRRLEDATDGISFIDEKRCESRSNLGSMVLKMVESGDFATFIDDVRTAVDGVDDFPEQAETPVVQELGRTQDVVKIALSADMSRRQLKDLAEHLKRELLKDPIIPLVEISGFSQRQLAISVPMENLRRYGISVADIANTIAQQNVDLPGGVIEGREQEVELRFADERITTDGLAELVIIEGDDGGEVRLGEIASIADRFEDAETYIEFDGKPAALLAIKKNSLDDSLVVFEAVEEFIEQQKQWLPPEVDMQLTQDFTSIVKDRLAMLGENSWQGIILVFLTLLLFFSLRYSFWVAMGLPVSFLAGFFLISQTGISINMLSMVALLLAIGILMDDAIVIAENIASKLSEGLAPLDAAIQGAKMVSRGVISSFLTTVMIFGSISFLEGNLGQILRVVPIVLLLVISISLVEAFLILPNHLQHSLSHGQNKKESWLDRFRKRFEIKFERFRDWVEDKVQEAIEFRYAVVGGTIALFLLAISMMASGVLKFVGLPEMDGDVVQARVLMNAGTPLSETQATVEHILEALQLADEEFSKREGQQVVKHVSVSFGENADAFETGPHLATISVDLVTAEQRELRLDDFLNYWRGHTQAQPNQISVLYKEPSFGPAGRPVHIRFFHDDLKTLSVVSQQLQSWMHGYNGVINIMDDLRPGRPELTLTLKPGATSLGLNSGVIASQLRSAFYGQKVAEVNTFYDNPEIFVELDAASQDSMGDFDLFPVIHPANGAIVPLSVVADIEQSRSYSRIERVDNQRVVNVYADIDNAHANSAQVIADLQKTILPELLEQYPHLRYSLEGEAANNAKTQGSMKSGFLLGLIGVFLLLSFQFRSYLEPIIVMIAIPLALIGVIFGHLVMGHSLAMPSMIGFISLAGIVVNNAILLVEFIKLREAEGMTVKQAAALACRDRMRAIVLTTSTTVAGMLPLLLETSLQAQVLIPLVISISFGLLTATVLLLFIVPCLYGIWDDFGLSNKLHQEQQQAEQG